MSESRYENCEVLKDGNKEYLGVRLPVEIPPRSDDRFHTVVTGDRLDVLAHRHLGDASLWWYLNESNDVAFPLDLPTGAVLKIPTLESLAMR